ncbi:MAG: hypothetical protein K2X77_21310 [Candidatus Obscuribacterales bacterium]|nr:hypothetical protein [Candidatus Obscuribacterales bacterium]
MPFVEDQFETQAKVPMEDSRDAFAQEAFAHDSFANDPIDHSLSKPPGAAPGAPVEPNFTPSEKIDLPNFEIIGADSPGVVKDISVSSDFQKPKSPVKKLKQ